MTNSTPWAVKHAMNASKSGATSISLSPQKLDGRDALGRRTRKPVLQLRPRSLHFLERRRPDDALQSRLSHRGRSYYCLGTISTAIQTAGPLPVFSAQCFVARPSALPPPVVVVLSPPAVLSPAA